MPLRHRPQFHVDPVPGKSWIAQQAWLRRRGIEQVEETVIRRMIIGV
jgi:hypothetical protein